MYSNRALKFDKLYELAESQKGFFAASQARELGYSRQLQSYHVASGDWIRKGRGIFRLKHFPGAFWPDAFHVIYLWALNRDGEPEGIFGYGTALHLHAITTYVPTIIDLIVPKHFRRHSKPPGRTKLYKQKLDLTVDVQRSNGILLTKPLKTIVDLLDTRAIDYDYILDGLDRSLKQFLITSKQIKQARLTVAQKERLIAALEQVKYERVDEIR